jgi:hypothetical protein
MRGGGGGGGGGGGRCRGGGGGGGRNTFTFTTFDAPLAFANATRAWRETEHQSFLRSNQRFQMFRTMMVNSCVLFFFLCSKNLNNNNLFNDDIEERKK